MRRNPALQRGLWGLAVVAVSAACAFLVPPTSGASGAAGDPQLTDSFNPGQIVIGAISPDTFTVTNSAGLTAKSGWSFTDQLPAGVVISAAPHAATTCAAATISAAPGGTAISVSGGTIAAGVASCTITVDVTAAAEGVYTNTAANYSAMVGLNAAVISGQLFVSNPEFTMTKVASESVAHPGDVVTYTIKITDTGGVAVADTSITDDLTKVLQHASFVSGSATASAGTASFSSPTLTWHGPVASDGTVTITYQVKVGSADPVATDTMANTVIDTTPNAFSNCETGTIDPTCTATVTIPPVPQSTIKIVETSTTPLVTSGGTIDYTLTVTNTGQNPDLAPVVTDTLVPGLTWGTPPAGCTVSGQTLTCILADLPPGQSTHIDVQATATLPLPAGSLDSAGKVPNDSRVRSSNTTDCPTASSTATECTSGVDTPLAAAPQSTIKIVETSPTPLATPGGTIDYTLTVTNTGTHPDLAPVVTDTLVPGLSWVSAPAGCTISGRTLTCTLADLAPGASTAIKGKATVSPSFPNSSLDAAGKVPNDSRVRSSNTTDCPTASSTAPECTSGVDTPLGGTSPVSVTAPPPANPGLAFTGTPVVPLLVVAQLALLLGIVTFTAGKVKPKPASRHPR